MEQSVRKDDKTMKTQKYYTPSRNGHSVTNQPPPLRDYNLYSSDPLVKECIEHHEVRETSLEETGKTLGTEEMIEHGRLANEFPPVLRSHSAEGFRLDEVEFHPSWHALMDFSKNHGIASYPTPGSGQTHLERAVLMYLVSQNEAGHGCPISMTYAAVPAIRHGVKGQKHIESLLTSSTYDPNLAPLSSKTTALAGMAMTEKQGGSDLRANSTTAIQNSTEDTWRITGHKWFMSAPMCDMFLTLAQTKVGLSCFLVPRVLDADSNSSSVGYKNAIYLERLKDKLGNRSNASAEVEFDNAIGYLVGEEGRGIKTILEMVSQCRLDSLIGSAAQMRQALIQAYWWVTKRSAFNTLLIGAPLMQNVLADLAIESAAANVTFLRLAEASDNQADPLEVSLRRIGTSISKFLVCKKASGFVAEALECVGGSGYVEESPLARLFRESPLNGIWEGSGNVNALDIIRILHKTPDTIEHFFDEIAHAKGSYQSLDLMAEKLKVRFGQEEIPESQARRVVNDLGLVFQGSLLARFGTQTITDAFIRSRIERDYGSVYGTLPADLDFNKILEESILL